MNFQTQKSKPQRSTGFVFLEQLSLRSIRSKSYLTLPKLNQLNHSKIPEHKYHELVDLIGKEKTEAFIISVKYDFRAVKMKIFKLRFERFCYQNQKAIYFILAALAQFLAITEILSLEKEIH